MNRRSFFSRILAAAVAAPAMDRIVTAAVPKPVMILPPIKYPANRPRAYSGARPPETWETDMITWAWTPLPYPKTEGVLDPEDPA